MLIDELKSLGLSDQEAQIYLAATELGPATVLELANKTKTHRTTVYHTVQGLLEKKLFSESARGKRRVFVPEGAEALKKMLRSKLERVDGIAGELLALSKVSSTKPIVKFYIGAESVKDMFRASVIGAKEKFQYGIFAVEEMMSSHGMKDFLYNEFSALREKHGLFGKIIVSDTEGGRQYKSLDKEKFRETKLLPASTYYFPGEVMVSDNLLMLFVISEKEQFVVTVESPAIATTVKMIFNALWTVAY